MKNTTERSVKEWPLDTDDIGVQLARRLSWDGLAILLVARAALTDANMHQEAKEVGALISAYLPYDCDACGRTDCKRYECLPL